MKAILLVLAFATVGAWHCHGQGTVGFYNSNTSLVYYVTASGTNALVPTNSQFRAELMFAPDGTPAEGFSSVAVRLGAAIPFGGGLNRPGLFNGGTRTAVNMPPGGFGLFQVRVWDTNYGASWAEAAVVPPCMVGASAILRVDTGDPTTTPPGIPTPLPSAGLASFTVGAQGCPVTFTDPNLEYAVRSALNFPPEGITTRNILLLSNLNACCSAIADLGGLEYARALESLDLSFNSLANVTFPGGLSNLTLLKLNGNAMTNLTFTGLLPRLRTLNLAENELRDFSTLANLPALGALNLQLNNLSTVALPPALGSLVSLDLGYNQVHDFAFLEPLQNLGELNIDDNGLRSVEVPTSLANLTTLTISINRITNLWFLTNFPYLTALDVSANFLPTLELPPDMILMSWINLSENRLRQFRPPSGWGSLGTLHLRDNLLTNVCVEGLNSLEHLNLLQNQLTSLFIPPALPLLRLVDVRFNALTNLTLPADLAAGNLASWVADLQSQGVQIQTFAESLRLSDPAVMGDSFRFTAHGPPGRVRIWRSPDFMQWLIADEADKTLDFLALTLPWAAAHQFYRLERLAVCP